MPPVPEPPRIRLLAMGGTISSVALGDTGEVSPSLKAEDLIASVPVLGEVARVEWGDIITIASFAVTLADMHAVARETVKAFDEGCDGVVVTHGTDTIEETGYALALMVPRGKPIMVTGAMRNPTLPGADGPGNLAAAFMAAARPRPVRSGPCCSSTTRCTRLVSRRSRTRLGPRRLCRPARPHRRGDREPGVFLVRADLRRLRRHAGRGPNATVPLIKVASEIDDVLLRAAIDQAPPAIVLEGFGGGHVPVTLLDAIDDAIARASPSLWRRAFSVDERSSAPTAYRAPRRI